MWIQQQSLFIRPFRWLLSLRRRFDSCLLISSYHFINRHCVVMNIDSNACLCTRINLIWPREPKLKNKMWWSPLSVHKRNRMCHMSCGIRISEPNEDSCFFLFGLRIILASISKSCMNICTHFWNMYAFSQAFKFIYCMFEVFPFSQYWKIYYSLICYWV